MLVVKLEHHNTIRNVRSGLQVQNCPRPNFFNASARTSLSSLYNGQATKISKGIFKRLQILNLGCDPSDFTVCAFDIKLRCFALPAMR